MAFDIASKDLLHQITTSLKSVYEEREASTIGSWLIEDLFELTYHQIHWNEKIEWSEERQQIVDNAISRLKNHEPLQYITGRAAFFGFTFNVSSDTLVPRPETEELVDLIIQENQTKSTCKILDIGTGTGCIPISLDKKLTQAHVSAIDISEGALKIARQNNEQLQAHVSFYQQDILTTDLSDFEKFDVIVSNPPYIRNLEKELMSENVLNYEPHLALFVENDTPLLFYERITFLASQSLVKGGKLYFEINEAFGKETAQVLIDVGFEGVEIIQDLQGKDRVVKGIW